MSDKFLTAAATDKPAASNSYADRRKAAQKKHLESQPRSLKQREEEARRKALATSLFDDYKQDGEGNPSAAAKQPGGKAMNMMMKMGWKVGEGLGKKGDDVSEPADIQHPEGREDRPDGDDEHAVGEMGKSGIGMNSRKRRRSTDSPDKEEAKNSRQRLEPIKISMWAGMCTISFTFSLMYIELCKGTGKTGLGARAQMSPPVLAPGELAPGRLEELATSTNDFRKRQAGENEARKVEGREWAARKIMVDLDESTGLKVRKSYSAYSPWMRMAQLFRNDGLQFHPLHVIPSAPAQTIPTPLLRLIFDLEAESLIRERQEYLARKLGAGSGGRVGVDDTYGHAEDLAGGTVRARGTKENMSEAASLKEMMRLDALEENEGDLEADDDEDLTFGGGLVKQKQSEVVENEAIAVVQDEVDIAPINWQEQVEGVNRVLTLNVSVLPTLCYSMLIVDGPVAIYPLRIYAGQVTDRSPVLLLVWIKIRKSGRDGCSRRMPGRG